jgi:hypothetical protein
MNWIRKPRFKPRKKLYYSTGMISLVMLPLLVFLFIQASPRFKKQHVLEINTFIPDNPFGWTLPLHQKQIEIRITGDSYRDSMILIASRWTIREFKQSKDTSSVIHFYFEEDAPYWTFVEVIDLCKRERVGNFIPFRNHLWVVNRPRKKLNIDDLRKREEEWGTCIRTCGGPLQIKKEKKPNQLDFYIKNAGVLWPASLILMLMIFVSIRNRRFTDPDR